MPLAAVVQATQSGPLSPSSRKAYEGPGRRSPGEIPCDGTSRVGRPSAAGPAWQMGRAGPRFAPGWSRVLGLRDLTLAIRSRPSPELAALPGGPRWCCRRAVPTTPRWARWQLPTKTATPSLCIRDLPTQYVRGGCVSLLGVRLQRHGRDHCHHRDQRRQRDLREPGRLRRNVAGRPHRRRLSVVAGRLRCPQLEHAGGEL